MELAAFLWRLRGFVRSPRAVSAVEYALLVGLVAVGVAAGLLAFGDDLRAALVNIGGPGTRAGVVNVGPIAGDANAG